MAGDTPQTLPFTADLAASRDTTIDLDWKAPPSGAASDISVDLEYGGGNVASWSSRLGGSAIDLSPPTSNPTPVTAATQASAPASTAPAAKPWWKRSLVTWLAILALVVAGAWFAFEIRASRRRRGVMQQPVRYGAPRGSAGWGSAGWGPPWATTGASEESLDLARQLVRLTDVVVQLVESHRADQDVAAERARARSPSPDESHWLDQGTKARAGPEPPGHTEVTSHEFSEPARSAFPTPGASPRPEQIAPAAAPIEALFVDEPDVVPQREPQPEPTALDPRAAVMERLMDLDRERRRLRGWMDSEDSGHGVDPPIGSIGVRPDGQRDGRLDGERDGEREG